MNTLQKYLNIYAVFVGTYVSKSIPQNDFPVLYEIWFDRKASARRFVVNILHNA